ncbi:hypothetical protein [Mesorhizobium sp. ES1-1]|uniref:VpaChn25_0724 family phage protein n=1 Tax=Mesorhizobium sp. ES1-1 TaxID=2876629 RepID=UPI001CCE6D82|nr:hypothetical protein [Mesorhizobium sp. ES1-1]MBZ9678909.1 hypothetical protein [Mesorhizobium sp. ES1-1]
MSQNEFQESARFIILGELARQTDGRLNERIIAGVLDANGYSKSREWLRTQLLKMEELGAVRLTEIGDTFVAAITRAGEEHYERKSTIDGISRRPREG